MRLNYVARLNPGAAKRSVDFVAIVSSYVKLRRVGRQYVGLCPFHSERTPSFYVDPQRKVFKCFGRCDARGDVFDFVMRAKQCSFPDAVRIVAGIAEAGAPTGARFGRGVRGEAPSARAARTLPSPLSAREAALARLDVTEARLLATRATNDASALDFATACEPIDGDGSLLLVNKRITGHE